jgi:[protein-PII] uridylyltransferase
MSAPQKTLHAHAKESLLPAAQGQLSPAERIALYKNFLKIEEQHIKQLHIEGAGGLETARARGELLDVVLTSAFESARAARGKIPPICLVATGGYGRGTLNPSSDIDLLFLLPRPSTKLPKDLQELVNEILYLLWDVGFKVGHACRSIGECIEQARLDQENKTALMDARLIVGDPKLFHDFMRQVDKSCFQKGQNEFFEIRRQDLRARHDRFSRTVFLQEPNVKEGCGGLRDYQNMLWVLRAKRGTSDVHKLVEERVLAASDLKELEEAHDFLHRVRNELHYHTGRATDSLTLQLQGVVATEFAYPQRSVLRRIEAFMRDYYRQTRHIYQHTSSVMETFQIEREDMSETGLRSFLTFRRKKREEFDGFIAREGRIFPANPDILADDPGRIMRLFQHCQLRGLRLSPAIRKLVEEQWEAIDRPFRYAVPNRETFLAILERKGEVARTLRLMHRAGVLGRYLPEFGALDCLVQHEFFHRYTADEHTLRCLEKIDELVGSGEPSKEIYRRLLSEIEDPCALYLAMILHDTGRAENVREHVDASAILASRLCNRLQVRGARRSLVMYLVDNHLTFWRTATTRNIEDPQVVAEFAAIVKSTTWLDALLLFTYADSNATGPDGWTGWKEMLILQLHSATKRYLIDGPEKYAAALDAERKQLLDSVVDLMRHDYHPRVREHFDLMPAAAFRFREPAQVVTQVRTVRHFLQREADTGDSFASCVKWIDQPDKGYSEMVLATRDKPLLLEKVCCALASEQINILSADFYTRADGVVVDIFRVCTTNFEPISRTSTRKRVLDIFEAIIHADSYEPEKYLKRRVNFLKARTDSTISVPVRAVLINDLHPQCSTIEVQALDRIGLLHDIFHTINSHGLTTVHARICTEKGAAVDTFYVTTSDGKKVEDNDLINALETELTDFIGQGDAT